LLKKFLSEDKFQELVMHFSKERTQPLKYLAEACELLLNSSEDPAEN
jgi:hypothetical protein